MIATSGIYKFLLALHLLAVIVGFGTVMLAGAFGAKAKAKGGAEGLAIFEATYDVTSTFAEWTIYTVPVFGILLVMASNDAWKFSQPWIGAALGIYIVAIAIVHGLHKPNLKRMKELMTEMVGRAPGGGPPPQAAEMEQRGKRAAMVGGLLNLLVVVEVVLMVWKPGGHTG